MSRLTRRWYLACFAVALSIIVAEPVSGQRECCEGDRWLKWKPAARETFVFGYALGYGEGHSNGCFQGTKGWPDRAKLDYENDPRRKCLEQQLDFSKGTDYFVKAITDFYTRYPGDRDIYINEVLEQLGKGLTLEQIHGYPFVRHSPTTK